MPPVRRGRQPPGPSPGPEPPYRRPPIPPGRDSVLSRSEPGPASEPPKPCPGQDPEPLSRTAWAWPAAGLFARAAGGQPGQGCWPHRGSQNGLWAAGRARQTVLTSGSCAVTAARTQIICARNGPARVTAPSRKEGSKPFRQSGYIGFADSFATTALQISPKVLRSGPDRPNVPVCRYGCRFVTQL